jgi:hypothetical protein
MMFRHREKGEVDGLTGDSTVRNVRNDEISPEDSQSNGSTSSSKDNSYNEYQTNLIYAILVQCFKMKYNVYVYKI